MVDILMPPSNNSPIGAGIFDEPKSDKTMAFSIFKHRNVERMAVYLFIGDFRDRLGSAQHDPMVSANENVMRIAICFGLFAKSLGRS